MHTALSELHRYCHHQYTMTRGCFTASLEKPRSPDVDFRSGVGHPPHVPGRRATGVSAKSPVRERP